MLRCPGPPTGRWCSSMAATLEERPAVIKNTIVSSVPNNKIPELVSAVIGTAN